MCELSVLPVDIILAFVRWTVFSLRTLYSYYIYYIYYPFTPKDKLNIM